MNIWNSRYEKGGGGEAYADGNSQRARSIARIPFEFSPVTVDRGTL